MVRSCICGDAVAQSIKSENRARDMESSGTIVVKTSEGSDF